MGALQMAEKHLSFSIFLYCYIQCWRKVLRERKKDESGEMWCTSRKCDVFLLRGKREGELERQRGENRSKYPFQSRSASVADLQEDKGILWTTCCEWPSVFYPRSGLLDLVIAIGPLRSILKKEMFLGKF